MIQMTAGTLSVIKPMASNGDLVTNFIKLNMGCDYLSL